MTGFFYALLFVVGILVVVGALAYWIDKDADGNDIG